MAGITHLVEHLVLRANAGDGATTAVDAIEKMGGDINAVTGREFLAVLARVPNQSAGDALDVVSHAVANLTLDDELFEPEKRVVIEEITLQNATPADYVHDVFFRSLFGRHPLGRPISGSSASVARLGMNDVRRLHHARVTAATTAGVAVGGADLRKLSRRWRAGPLHRLPLGRWRPDRTRTAPRLSRSRPRPRHLPLEGDYAYIMIGGVAGPQDATGGAAWLAAIEHLAIGKTSVVSREIRSRLGLAYDVSAWYSTYQGTGAWRIAIGTSPEQVDETTKATLAAIRSNIDSVDSRQLELARERAAARLLLETELSVDLAFEVGRRRVVLGVADWLPAAEHNRILATPVTRIAEVLRELAARPVYVTSVGRAETGS